MSTRQHTPGPWVAIQNPEWPNAKYGITSDPSKDWAAAVDSGVASVNGEANARLIAAAPELLAMVERLTDARGNFTRPETYRDAQALLLRARGEKEGDE